MISFLAFTRRFAFPTLCVLALPLFSFSSVTKTKNLLYYGPDLPLYGPDKPLDTPTEPIYGPLEQILTTSELQFLPLIELPLKPLKISVWLGQTKLGHDVSAIKKGDNFYAPLSWAGYFKGKIDNRSSMPFIAIKNSSEKLPIEVIDEIQYFCINNWVDPMQNELNWDERQSTLSINSKLLQVTALKHNVTVKTSFPIQWKTFKLTNPDRIVMDAKGVYLDPDGVKQEVDKDVSSIRFGTLDNGSTRIVCIMNSSINSLTAPKVAKSNFALAWMPKEEIATSIINTPTWEVVGKEHTFIHIPTNQKTTAHLKSGKNALSLVIDLPNSLLKNSENAIANINEGPVKQMRLSMLDNLKNHVQLALDLRKIVGINLIAKATEILVEINKPHSASGAINQKVIVIDPGHGGSDPGAQTASFLKHTGGQLCKESDITLAIGTLVAEKLANQGASVIMTRSEDAKVILQDRPQIANSAKADFFVSIHVNSNSKLNSTSGTYVYYHKGIADSEALANAIQAEIGKISGIPNHGILDDKTRFPQTGMAVLRLSKMPAVLIETGYINNDKDRSCLIDSEWQNKIAAAIVRGIKRYLGDYSSSDDN